MSNPYSYKVNLLAGTSYIVLGLLVLQTLALTVMCILEYTLHNQQPTEVNTETSTSIISTLGAIASGATATLPTRTTDNPNTILIVAIVAALVAVLCALALYLTKIMAGITHSLLGFLGRPTLNKLLTVKIALAGMSFVIITICAVILPSVIPILPLDIGLVVLCFVASLLEHALATRAKLPVTKAL